MFGVLLMAAASFFAVSSASLAETPGRANVKGALETLMPQGLRLKDFDYKVFEGGDGRGRVSVSGVAETTAPWVSWERRRFAPMRQDLLSRGLTEEEYRTYMYLSRYDGAGSFNNLQLSLFHPVLATGRSVKISSELTYLEKVEGFKFIGSVEHEACCQPAIDLGPGAVVIGSERYQDMIARVLSWRTVLPDAQAHASREHLFGALRHGAIVYEDDQPVAALGPMEIAQVEWTLRHDGREQGRPVDYFSGALPVSLRSLSEEDRQIGRAWIESGAERMIALRFNYYFMKSVEAGAICAGLGDEGYAPYRYVCRTAGGDFVQEDLINQRGRAWDGPRLRISPADGETVAAAVAAMESRRTRQAAEEKAAAAAEAAAEQARQEEEADRSARAQDAAMASLVGVWTTPDGSMAFDFQDGRATIVSGGSGARPDGSIIIEVDQADGARLQGRFAMSNGSMTHWTGTVLKDQLHMQAGGYSFSWKRGR